MPSAIPFNKQNPLDQAQKKAKSLAVCLWPNGGARERAVMYARFVVLFFVCIHFAIAVDAVDPYCFSKDDCRAWKDDCRECSSLTSNRDCVSRDYCQWDQGTAPKYPITSADIAFTVGSLLCELYTVYRLLSVAFLPTSCHVVSSGTRTLLWSVLIYTQCMAVCDILVYKKCWIKVSELP